MLNATYDGLNQLIGTSTTYDGSQPDHQMAFTYDGNFNVIVQAENGVSSSFSYTPADQLVGPGIVYDSNGRMTADGLGRVYTYNALDQLVSTAGATLPMPGQLAYHADSSLSSVTTSEFAQSFYYSGGAANVLAATGAQGETMTTFLLDTSGRRAAYGAGQEPRYYIGSMTSTALVQQGSSVTTMEYGAYGAPVDRATGDAGDAFGWNQEYADAGAGLVYLRSRFYSPQFKRFMSMDNLTTDNRYAYCEGNPLNLVDPGGHASTGEILGMVFGSVVGIAATVATGGAAGAAAAMVFGTESVAASVTAATLAGAAGAVAGDATNAGISGQQFTAQRALIDAASGGAGGAAGAGIGSLAGRTAMAAALARNLSQQAITNIGLACSGLAGGLAGASAASAVSAGAYGQPFFSANTALSMAIGAAAGVGGGFLASGAYLGKLSPRIIPVPLSGSLEDLGRVLPVARPADFISVEELLVMAPQAEANQSRQGFQDLAGGEQSALSLRYDNPAAPRFDTIAAHGAGNTMFVSVNYQGAVAVEPDYVRPMRGDNFGAYLRANPARIGGLGGPGGNNTPVKLMSCFGAFSNAQTIANAIQRPVYAGYPEIDRYSFTNWKLFSPR